MNPELITNACEQYNNVLLPGEKMITEINSPSKERCQRTTFEKKPDSTFLVTFEKPGYDPIKYTYPPVKKI